MLRISLRVSTALVCLALPACATDDLPVSPPQRTPTAIAHASSVQPAVHVDSGCASIVVYIGAGSSPKARHDTTARCGLASFEVDSQVARSARGDTIAIVVSLRNEGAAPWRAPIWLFIDEDSLDARRPQSGAATAPRLIDSDTVVAELGSARGRRHGWRLRRTVPDSIIMRVFPGGHTTSDTLRVLVDPAASSVTIRIRAYAAIVDRVAPMAPPRLPREVMVEMSSSRIVITKSKLLTGPFPRNYMQMYFREGTTVESKQAAVDLVGGEVVGGLPMTPEGWYFVRLPETTSDTTLLSAIAMAKALPQTRWVTPVLLGDIRLHRRPNDGTNWTRTSWRLDKSRTSGHTWAMERINAPLAWGCTTGSDSPRIGVIESFFRSGGHVTDDLLPNVDPTRHNQFTSDTAGNHGTRVLSLIAAQGDNTEAMSGVMWNATLLPANTIAIRDTLQFGLYPAAMYELRRMLLSGNADIINLSVGLNWLQEPSIGHRPSETNTADTLRRRAGYDNVEAAYHGMMAVPASDRPLIVVAAGNDRVDASWAATAHLAVLDSTNVVVVAGARRAYSGDSLWRVGTGSTQGGSNYGNLPVIAAPAEDVYSSTGSSISPATGTSFAAPLVAGAAGLLLSANPDLTAPELRALLLSGARASGLTAGGYPVLDVYRSLVHGARRPGVPLCGNRVWTTGTAIVVERDSTTVETIATAAETSYPSFAALSDIDVFHGGDTVAFGWLGHTTLSSGTWTQSTSGLYPAPPQSGGIYPDWDVLTHDRDSSITYRSSSTGPGVPRNDSIFIKKANSSGGGRRLAVITKTEDYSAASEECVMRDSTAGSTCRHSEWVGTMLHFTGPKLAISPTKNRLLAAYNYNQRVVTLTSGWGPCPWTGMRQCRSISVAAQTLGVDVHSVTWSGTTPTVTLSTALRDGEWMPSYLSPQLSQLSDEFVLYSIQQTSVSTAPASGSPGNYYFEVQSHTVSDCKTRYFSTSSAALTRGPIAHTPCSVADGHGSGFGGSSFAPRRTGPVVSPWRMY